MILVARFNIKASPCFNNDYYVKIKIEDLIQSVINNISRCLMFGLEDQKKKKKNDDFTFDLENELKTPKKHQEIKKAVEGKIQKVKEVLRGGENKEEFDQFGILLHGYTSLLKVMARFVAK